MASTDSKIALEEKVITPRDVEDDCRTTEDEVAKRLRCLREQHGATWDDSQDPNDPYNWSSTRKIVTAVIVSMGQLITLMSTSMIAAPLATIATDLHMNSQQAQITFSIFTLGTAVGPFFVAALSEMYGRKPIWLFCNVWYVLWNAICPIGHSKAVMTVGRFLSGAGASAGITLTAPILTDLYRKEHRGKSIAMATFIPYLGPALGPIIGGVVSQSIRWEWSFYILSIFAAVNTLLAVFFFNECYTPTLLRNKATALNELPLTTTKSTFHRPIISKDLASRLKLNMKRPLMLLVRRPILQFIALQMSLNFGIYCLVLSTYANLWIRRYGQSETISSLNYIAIAIGTTLASQGGGPLMDIIFRYMRARNGGKTPPEVRVPFMIPSVLFPPMGLIISGWSAQYRVHWVAVDIGTAIFVTGSFLFAQGLTAYLYDEFSHAASANAAVRTPMNLLGFAFPIFAPAMYDKLGQGWGNSLLAFVFLVACVPTPALLWFQGPRLRALGRKDGE